MKVFKLTNKNMRAHCGFQWTLGETRSSSGDGGLCGPGWLHAYEHPLLAVLYNPMHGNFRSPRLFEAETGDGRILRDGQVKLGTNSLTLVKELPLPVVTLTQYIAYSILCARRVTPRTTANRAWHLWAKNWLSGKDRSPAAFMAYEVPSAAAWAARAADALRVAHWAAEAATRAKPNIDLVTIAIKAVSDKYKD